jgi:hypothetical protein
MINPWEAAGRERKVLRLVEAIDRGEKALDLNDTELCVASRLETWTDEEWEVAAKIARVNSPSPETRAAVIAVYERRAEWDREDPFARSEATARDRGFA